MSKHIIKIRNINCGSDTMFLIAGPCVIENELIMFEAAEKLKKISEQAGISLIFKSSFQKDNRSALNNYKGPGLEAGLKLLQKIKKDFDLPILSDVHYPTQVKAAAEVLDIIQIPAYLCMQTDLVVEAAKTGRVINLKHGQFIAPDNMVKPLNKIIESGNNQIIITERGYTFGYNDLIVDPRSFYHLNNLGYPVVFDITHSVRRYGIPSFDPKGASREFLPVIARAGVAAGVDGIFIESHPDPSKALCDAASQINLNKLADFIKPLIEMHSLVSKYRNNDTEQY